MTPVASTFRTTATYAYYGIFGALSLTILVIAARSGSHLTYTDEQDYLDIATAVAHGDGYTLGGQPTAYRPPAWPLALAAWLFLRLPQAWIGVVSAAFLIAGALVGQRIAARIAGYYAGLVAGLAILLYPLNVYTAFTLYPQAFATAMLLIMWWVASISADPHPRTLSFGLIATLGFVAAMLVLAVPTMVFTAALVLGFAWWKQRGQRMRYLLVAGAFLLLPIAAWTVRNEIETGSPTPLSTTSGLNLLLGNNENATADSGVDVDIDRYNDVASTLGDEAAVDRYFRDSAVEWITSNPHDALRLYGTKVVNYFSAYNSPATEGQYRSIERFGSWLAFGAIVALTCVRIALRRTIPLLSSEKAFLAIFALNAFFMAIFFTRTRFRQPLDSILIVESAIAIVALAMLLYERRKRGPKDTPIVGVTE